MAAEILEQLEDTTPTDAIPVDDTVMTQEDLVTDLAPADTLAPIQSPEDDIPEKYRGKSIKEVIGMHQSAESLIGTQGSEVGELRKVVDGYIQSQLQPHTPEPPAEPVDFFEDPAKAVSQAIETHPDVVNARQQAQEMKRTTSLNQLQQKHPDMQQVLQAPAFAEWVKASPIRMELYDRADKGFDFGAADELVGNFKERTAVAQQAVQTETAVRQQAVKAASTGSATGTGNAGTKRVYRRADIIKLMKTDPDRYEALNPEIMLAYQEGRVR
jgi:hypothetical protein